MSVPHELPDTLALPPPPSGPRDTLNIPHRNSPHARSTTAAGRRRGARQGEACDDADDADDEDCLAPAHLAYRLPGETLFYLSSCHCPRRHCGSCAWNARGRAHNATCQITKPVCRHGTVDLGGPGRGTRHREEWAVKVQTGAELSKEVQIELKEVRGRAKEVGPADGTAVWER
ncbi:hypothetical protein G7046_g4864 [Stylonectria norvegica]|nr:hypothetical protein G7046_g4864 [Stylonectria norvegica]